MLETVSFCHFEPLCNFMHVGLEIRRQVNADKDNFKTLKQTAIPQNWKTQQAGKSRPSLGFCCLHFFSALSLMNLSLLWQFQPIKHGHVKYHFLLCTRLTSSGERLKIARGNAGTMYARFTAPPPYSYSGGE